MSRRRRHLAPVTEAVWAVLDEQAARRLRGSLAARRLVDFSGPLGYGHPGVALGRVAALPEPAEGVVARRREVRPMVELEVRCALALEELAVVDRGGADPDLGALDEAAGRIALAEDRLVFHGLPEAGIVGILPGSPHSPVELAGDAASFPKAVAKAVGQLERAGVEGPYGVALSPQLHASLLQASEHGGYPVLEHVRLVTQGPVVPAAALEGAVVLSLRGGDFELQVGEDLGLGYVAHDDQRVHLLLDELLTFSNHGPEAAVVIGGR
ncbi:family 1 encapsulin nanocompartment shell protein [Aciditerrimonas ferrireducens]|uniref:family 1 encapsulin nanocompartment shell protein n=1 Tax=Aciditerrimonas ferrireducens TaxID=667306 RepID=UPI0020053FE4|nr:family 1 encapsulin nanocompartment shell protein [Aciditerrimonas ferrireducens]MCK4176214.1 bacteriocin family protein [Aciditerrimonas ferrireducens]